MSNKKNTTQVEVIRPPVVETKVKIIIEGHEFEMTESEAKAFANDLCDKLGIRAPILPTDGLFEIEKKFREEQRKRPRVPQNPRPYDSPYPCVPHPMFPGGMPDYFKTWCSTDNPTGTFTASLPDLNGK